MSHDEDSKTRRTQGFNPGEEEDTAGQSRHTGGLFDTYYGDAGAGSSSVQSDSYISDLPLEAEGASLNLSDLSEGSVVADKYEILDVIGKGGMSTVFRVRHLQLDTILALKVLDKSLWQDETAMSRFKMEAQTIGMLSHPSLISYRDFGISSGGQPYLLMDYVSGEDLSQRLDREGLFTLTEAYDLWTQVCGGLALAHSKGIIHRDLKPGNIMFDAADGDRVKIVDFGVAKIVTEDANQMQALTRTGEVFGSPLYMSPEQCKGMKVDLRSDIYSLGCVIYEVITGTHPIAGNTMLETLTNHVEKVHPPPIEVDSRLGSVDRAGWVNVDDFQYIILKCLQKNPKDRYQSVDELVSDLESLKQKTLVKQELPKGTVNDLRRNTATLEERQSPKELITMVSTILFLCLGVGAAGVATWYLFFQEKPDSLSISVSSKKTEKAISGTGKKEKSMNVLLDGSAGSEDASQVDNKAARYMNNKEYDLAIPLLEFSLASYRQKGHMDILVAEHLRKLANCYANKKSPDYQKAVDHFRQAESIYKKLPGGAGGPMWQQCLREHAKVLRALGNEAEAKEKEAKANSFREL